MLLSYSLVTLRCRGQNNAYKHIGCQDGWAGVFFHSHFTALQLCSLSTLIKHLTKNNFSFRYTDMHITEQFNYATNSVCGTVFLLHELLFKESY